MSSYRRVDVQEFVDGLRGFEQGIIRKEQIFEYCSGLRLKPAALAPYLSYRPDRYSRHLIFRDRLFEVMAICWEPGQKTPIHTHNGQLGWMFVERGVVEVVNYRYRSCNVPENQNVVGIDCLGGATKVELDAVGSEQVATDSEVSTVDKIQTTHSIECPAAERERTVSIHIYSVPFDSCIAFDLERSACVRRSLFWDSLYGKPVDPEEARLPVAPLTLPRAH